jgi:thiol:disulfide interchange protein DsbD
MNTKIKAKFFLPLAFALLSVFAVLAPDPNFQTAQSARAASSEGAKHTTLRMVADVKEVVPGSTFMLGVELTMQPGWHTYYKESGDAGMPTSIEWVLPPGYKAGELLWQKPHKFDDGGIVTYGYADKTVIAAKVTAPDTIPDGEQKLVAKVKWLECKELCIPGSGETSMSLPAGKKGATAAPGDTDLFKDSGFDGKVSDITAESHGTAGGDGGSTSTGSSGTTAQNSSAGSILDRNLTPADTGGTMPPYMYFALAVLGGFILNFMPCVLPVIAIKIISLMEQVDDEPGRVRLQGLVFAAGILSSFLVLGGVVLAAREAGQSVGWGFQMQYPPFVIAMATIIMIFSLSLFGLFYVTVNPGQAQIDKLASKEGLTGTFFKGVLATVLSTPCTAPALGPAVGFAFAQSPIVILGIFEAVGLGMSLPYLLLTINPNWLRFIPKPGVWMEKFKEAMGFVLLATVAWLLSVVGAQVGASGVQSVGFFLTGIAFAVWVSARFTDLSSTTQRKAVVWSISGVISAVCLYVFVLSRPDLMGNVPSEPATAKTAVTESGITWLPFSIDDLDKNIAANKTIFLDFTADWCLTCKVNEKTVLESAPVVEQLKALNVVTMKADWTRRDETISKLLQKFQRSGVPLYVVFPAGKGSSPIVLPEVITPQLVVDKLKEAGPSKG